GSLVSPLTEESAFRGYAQSLLERRLPAVLAVAISSALFALWHGPTQGFFWSKLLFFFLVGVVFGTIACLTDSILPALPVHVVGAVRLAARQLGLGLTELLGATERFVHGTTQATNAILTRTGARTGLITTRGHEDAIIIGKVHAKVAGLPERDLVHSSRLKKP